MLVYEFAQCLEQGEGECEYEERAYPLGREERMCRL